MTHIAGIDAQSLLSQTIQFYNSYPYINLWPDLYWSIPCHSLYESLRYLYVSAFWPWKTWPKGRTAHWSYSVESKEEVLKSAPKKHTNHSDKSYTRTHNNTRTCTNTHHITTCKSSLRLTLPMHESWRQWWEKERRDESAVMTRTESLAETETAPISTTGAAAGDTTRCKLLSKQAVAPRPSLTHVRASSTWTTWDYISPCPGN